MTQHRAPYLAETRFALQSVAMGNKGYVVSLALYIQQEGRQLWSRNARVLLREVSIEKRG
jgi:hypothetical protein